MTAFGVLALQGDYGAHVDVLRGLGGVVREVRRCAELRGLTGLIIPGGESTTLLNLMQDEPWVEALRDFHEAGGALFGTCAGAILLSREVRCPSQPSLGFLDAVIARNAYGRQVDSFEAKLDSPALGGSLKGVFIRAPRFLAVGPAVEVLACLGEDPVLVRQRRLLAGTFHPELAGSDRVHRLFMEVANGVERPHRHLRRMDPVTEIAAERERAREQGDPLADVCYLATVAADGRPQVRALTLRDVGAEGFGLLLSRTSPKWEQIRAHGGASLLLHWHSVRRQYRVWGSFRPMPAENIAGFWSRKSRGSQLLEHYYDAFHPQSQPIASRAHLERGLAELARRYPDTEAVPIPENLLGVYLFPQEIETWHGSPENRLHDRRLFRRDGSGWSCQRLVP